MKVLLFWLLRWGQRIFESPKKLPSVNIKRNLARSNITFVIIITCCSVFYNQLAYATWYQTYFDSLISSVSTYAPSGDLNNYPIINSIGQSTNNSVPLPVEYTASEVNGALEYYIANILKNENLRIQGFPKHDAEMVEYRATAQKRTDILQNSSLDQYQNYHNGVARTAAFASSLVYADALRTKTELEKAGFTLIEYFDDRRTSQDNQFFLASKIVNSKRKYLIAIRGTESLTDVRRDANAGIFSGLQLPGVVGEVHKGFGYLAQAVYNNAEVQNALKDVKGNNADLLITGHSLGGAAANIFTIMLQESGVPLENMQTYTFGAAPVGNQDFFNKYESKGRVFRVVNMEDPVPYSAYMAGYKHIGQVHEFTLIGSVTNPGTCGYISPQVSGITHVSLSDIEQKIAIGFSELKTGGEQTFVTLSKFVDISGESIYRLTTLSGSTFVKIVNGKLIPIKGDISIKSVVSSSSISIDVNLNFYPNEDFEKNLDQLVEDINKLSENLKSDVRDIFDKAISAGNSFRDGIADGIVYPIGGAEYKFDKSAIIATNIISYHLAYFAGLTLDHPHSMDNMYFNAITCFGNTDIYKTMSGQNILVGSTKTVSNPSVLLSDSAMLISESPQDDAIFSGESAFTKKWTLKNTGTSTWNSGYKLQYVKGDGLSLNHSEIKINGTVSPGNSYTFEVPMKVLPAESIQRTLTDTWGFVSPTGVSIEVSNSPTIWARVGVSSVVSKCPADSVPEALTGFTSPLPYTFSNNGGYQFKQKALYKDYVYHPGEDWNVPNAPGGAGDGDQGLDVVAVADGKVVAVASDNWGGLVIQHNYQGKTWYSQYGHVQHIIVGVDSTVKKGQKVAEIGRVGIGSSYAHLHFEIRTANHPNPCYGSYWTYGQDGLYNLSNVESWYTSPVEFISTHSKYSPINIQIVDKGNGDIKISGTNLGASGSVLIDGKTVQGQWAADGITLNVGMTQESIVQPLNIKVVDSTGKETANICYPFIDVCPKTWIARPITHLWKQNMVTGYGDKQWEGYFRPFESTARAEFTAALIKTLEPGKTFVTPATDPFADVSKNHPYAPFIQRAKELGLIQGCDTTNNLFCPDKAITRAEAPKVLVLAYPDLKQVAIDYQQGKTPNKIYPDVTDKQQWYYPYIYAVQAARIAQGYKDGTFQPSSALKRAEMAQMLCIAKFGVMACTDMGDTATKALVLTVSPYKAQLNQSTIFTVHGLNLAETMSLSVQDCSNITRLSHASDKQTYQCTPTLIGSKTAKMTDSTGTVLYSGTVQVEGVVAPVTLPRDTATPPTTVTPPANCTPAVTDVSPLTATLNQATTFTVNGSCLSDTTAFFIDECPGQGANQVTIQAAGGSATQRQFVCTPSYKTGSHSGVVKNQAGGNTLLAFNVDYVSTSTTVVTPPAATPSVSCSPTATSVTPLTATLGQATTFTVNGSCLSDTTAFYIDECAGQVNLGGTAQQRQFSCTPSYKTGVHNGVVKDQTAGNQLLTFSTNYQWGTPKVDSVTPSTAKLNQLNSFIITGSSLLDTTIAWIDGCSGLQMFAGDANKRTFQCTATKAGTVSLIVKDKSGGTALYNSTVTVQ